LKQTGQRPLDPDDLDGDGEVDFLTATKHKIDNYIAKQVHINNPTKMCIKPSPTIFALKSVNRALNMVLMLLI
jgi:hypothetical protein